MLQTPHVRLTIVEMAYGERPHHIIDVDNVRHVHLRSNHELWHKENMINIGISRLPHDWKYVAWVDGDISFYNPSWAKETIEALQHYQIVQPWSSAIDLGPEGEAFATYNSFCWCVINGHTEIVNSSYYYGDKPGQFYPHTGYAWAARREAINTVAGLLDTAIVGAGDHHQAWALIGKGAKTVPKGVHPNYLKKVLEWQERAQGLSKNIGFVPGTILHNWHGKKKDRKYVPRWKVLTDNAFDPETDIKRDWHHLWQLVVKNERQINLRDAVRNYMSSRNEDSVDAV